MNAINGSEVFVPMQLPHTGGFKPRATGAVSDFGHMVKDAAPIPPQESDCEGSVNQVDMDAFFAAWGTDNAEFDIDNNGVVNGADLAVFLSASNSVIAGSVDDIYAQWGFQGESTADLNGDLIVDGEDLALALAENEESVAQDESGQPALTKLEILLSDWGTNERRSDLNNDNIVDGLDLSILLGGGGRVNNGSDDSPAATFSVDAGPIPFPGGTTPAPVTDPGTEGDRLDRISDRVFSQLRRMGFSEVPPQNLQELVNAFQFKPTDSKMMFSKIIDLFGGRDGGLVAKG